MNDLVVVKGLIRSLLSVIDKDRKCNTRQRFGKFCFKTVTEKSSV